MARTSQKKIAFIFIPILMVFKMDVAHATSNFEKAGNILEIAIPAAAYGSTFHMDDDKGREQFYYSFFTNLGVTLALKYTINKPRPEGNGDYAFPSGHTSAAFQGATFLQRRYGWKYGVPAFVCAAYVGWSRIEGESDKHDTTDVLGGAAVGIVSSLCFTTPYKGIAITPIVDAGRYGLTINIAW